MPKAAPEPEFAEPTRSSRIKALLAFFFAGMVWLFFGPAWRALIQPRMDLPVCEALPWIRGAAAFYLVSFLLVAALCARFSYLILRSGQVPVPGAWLLFRRRIRRGWSAKLDGMAAGAMALFFIGLVAWLWVFFELGLIFCLTEPCGC